jgi:hypothetical protein
MQIPVDPVHTPELMAVIEPQQARRRPTCPFIFHGRNCGAPRSARYGNRRPCLGDFQKVWDRACAAMGMAGRIPHDLRRSGVKHCIDTGVDPHTVMLWSGPRIESMLRRYHIVDLDDLRRDRRRGMEDETWRPGTTWKSVPAGAVAWSAPMSVAGLAPSSTKQRSSALGSPAFRRASTARHRRSPRRALALV